MGLHALSEMAEKLTPAGKWVPAVISLDRKVSDESFLQK